ncbi:MAG: MFS transporter [Candidatus Asgardarchaeia archaeon]
MDKRLLLMKIVTFCEMSSASMLNVSLSLYMQSLGMDEFYISLLTTAYFAALFTSIFWGSLSDNTGKRGSLLSLSLVLSSIANISFLFLKDPILIVIFRGVVGLSVAMFLPVAIATTTIISGGRDHGSSIGSLSSFQSLGFGTGLIVGGFISQLSIETSFIVASMISLFASVLMFLNLSKTDVDMDVSLKQALKLSFKNMVKIVSSKKGSPPEFKWVYLASFLREFSVLGAFSLFVIYLDYLGASPGANGILNSINSLLQVPFMIVAGRMTRRFGCKRTIAVGIIGSALTPVLWALSPSYEYAALGQVLMSFSFPSFFVGTRTFIANKTTEEERGEGMGRIDATRSIGGVLGPIFMSFLYKVLNFRLAYILISSSALFGALIMMRVNEDKF